MLIVAEHCYELVAVVERFLGAPSTSPAPLGNNSGPTCPNCLMEVPKGFLSSAHANARLGDWRPSLNWKRRPRLELPLYSRRVVTAFRVHNHRPLCPQSCIAPAAVQPGMLLGSSLYCRKGVRSTIDLHIGLGIARICCDETSNPGRHEHAQRAQTSNTTVQFDHWITLPRRQSPSAMRADIAAFTKHHSVNATFSR